MAEYMRLLEPWDERGFQLARLAAGWSKDPTTKVGCAILRPNKTVAGLGYNGFPQGTLDNPSLLLDKEVKRLRTVHAEQNAIDFSYGDISGCTYYVTHPVCSHCAGRMIQRGAAMIICDDGPSGLSEDWQASIYQAVQLCEEARIPLLFRHRILTKEGVVNDYGFSYANWLGFQQNRKDVAGKG